jgi:hypothetical protein
MSGRRTYNIKNGHPGYDLWYDAGALELADFNLVSGTH